MKRYIPSEIVYRNCMIPNLGNGRKYGIGSGMEIGSDVMIK